MDQAESAAEWPPLEPIWQMVGRFWKIQYGVESLLRNTLPMFTDEDWTHLTAGQLRHQCQEWYRDLGVSEFVHTDKALEWIKRCVANRNCLAHADLDDDGRLWGGEHGQAKAIEITQHWLENAHATGWVTLHIVYDLSLWLSAQLNSAGLALVTQTSRTTSLRKQNTSSCSLIPRFAQGSSSSSKRRSSHGVARSSFRGRRERRSASRSRARMISGVMARSRRRGSMSARRFPRHASWEQSAPAMPSWSPAVTPTVRHSGEITA